MMNGSMAFNSDDFENLTQNQSKPWKTQIYWLTHGILLFRGRSGILHPPPVWI